MHKLLSASLIAAALSSPTSFAAVDRSRPPALGPVAPFALPTPVTFTLKNGLKVHFIERHRAPLVDVVVHVGGGALADPAGQEGVNTAVADLLTQGAGSRDAFAFDDAVQGLGARIAAGADWTGTTIAAHGLSARADDILALLGDAVLTPRFADDDWARKQQERLGELAYYKDEPRALGGLAAARALFSTGRQSIGIVGTPKSIATLSTAQIKRAWATTFRPDNAYVVVAGDIDKAKLTAALEKALGSWTAPATPLPTWTRVEPTMPAARRVVLVDKPGAAQSVVNVVQPIPATTAPLDPAAGVVQTILGGSFTSRLNGNLREVHGYAYGAGYAIDVVPAHRSRVTTSVKSAVTVAAVDEILIELARIREPIVGEELNRGRAYEALTFPGVLDGGSSLVTAWAGWIDLGIEDSVVANYMDAVLAVDTAAAQRSAQALVDPDHVVIVVVGDAASLAKPLEKFGPVSRLSANELLPAPSR